MDIKDVEQLLSVSRANVRFYERAGLIRPQRRENNYRDYSQDDVEQLKKVLILRKMGFTVREIADMQNGELDLSDAIPHNMERLQNTVKELQGSLTITQMLARENPAFDAINVDRYWKLVCGSEQEGQQFTDICRDYLRFELEVFDSMWERAFLYQFGASRKKHGAPLACGILFLLCILRGLAKQFIWQGTFWEGFFYPFVLFLAVSVILLPLYILSKKAPKAAGILAGVLLAAGLLFLALLVLLIIVLIANSVFHFWF